MSSSDFTRRRAQQLMNGGVPVAANGPLAEAASSQGVYGVLRGPDNSVTCKFGGVWFTLERDDAIRMAMLMLKYAGAEVDYGEEPAG